MGIFESDGVPGMDGVNSPVSTPREGPMILLIYSSKSLSSAFGGGVLPLKSEIRNPTCSETERHGAYEGYATVSLGLTLCLCLAHLLEFCPFSEDFRSPFVGHDGSVRSSDHPLGYPQLHPFALVPLEPLSSVHNGS
jgi:hypothetical protein